MNYFFQANSEKNASVFMLTLDALLYFTKKRFIEEEAIMPMWKYPDCEEHRKKHAILLENVTKKATRIQWTLRQKTLLPYQIF